MEGSAAANKIEGEAEEEQEQGTSDEEGEEEVIEEGDRRKLIEVVEEDGQEETVDGEAESKGAAEEDSQDIDEAVAEGHCEGGGERQGADEEKEKFVERSVEQKDGGGGEEAKLEAEILDVGRVGEEHDDEGETEAIKARGGPGEEIGEKEDFDTDESADEGGRCADKDHIAKKAAHKGQEGYFLRQKIADKEADEQGEERKVEA